MLVCRLCLIHIRALFYFRADRSLGAKQEGLVIVHFLNKLIVSCKELQKLYGFLSIFFEVIFKQDSYFLFKLKGYFLYFIPIVHSMRKEPKTTICTCLCVDAMLVCRLCLIHIRALEAAGRHILTVFISSQSCRNLQMLNVLLFVEIILTLCVSVNYLMFFQYVKKRKHATYDFFILNFANCLFVYCLLHLCIRMFIVFWCNINHCNDSAPCWDLDWTIKSYLILSVHHR
jgi:hypothetical protein